MARTKTLKKQKKSATKFLMVHEAFTSDELKDAQLVIDTLLECIKTGDIDSFREVLTVHLLTINS